MLKNLSSLTEDRKNTVWNTRLKGISLQEPKAKGVTYESYECKTKFKKSKECKTKYKCSIREHEQMCKFYNNATKFIRVHDYNGVNCIRVQYC